MRRERSLASHRLTRRIATQAVVALLAGALLAPAAVAADAGGRIYGGLVRNGSFVPASVLPDGSELRDEPVLHTGGGRPVLNGVSHDGTTFLQRTRDPLPSGGYGLREVPLDTPVPVDILPRGNIALDGNAADRGPVAAYSRDGSQVAFVGTRTIEPFQRGVYVVNVAGSVAPRLLFELPVDGEAAAGAVFSVGEIAFSPTNPNELLMLRAYNTPASCFVVDEIDLATGALERHVTSAVPPHCAGSAHAFAYLPSGGAIVMNSPFFDGVNYDYGSVVHTIASGNDRTLVDPRTTDDNESSGRPAAVAPDSTEVAYRVQQPNEVRIVTVDNPQRRPLEGLHELYFWAPTDPPALVSIDSGPPGLSRSPSATFAFSIAGSPSGQFECRLDGAAFAACSSPVTFDGLAEGDHTFAVRFVPSSEPPSQPTEVGWRVDTIAPVTVLESGPSGTGNPPEAEIRFASSATDVARFECSLDGGASIACESPLNLTGLAPGTHRLLISAIDLAGNVENPPVELAWSVAGPPPPVVACDIPVASAGVLVAKALNEQACWLGDTIDGAPALASEGPVSVNGIRIDPKPGVRVLVAPQLSGGSLVVTGPSRVSIGAAGFDLARRFTWDGVAQGALVTINKALEVADKKFGGLDVTAPPSIELSADNGGQTKVTLKFALPATTFTSIPGRPANAEAQKGALISTDITLTTSNDFGITGGGKITVPELWLFGRVKLRDLSVGYDGASGTFEGTLGIELATLGTLPLRSIGKDATVTVGVTLGPDGFIGPLRKLGVKLDGLEKHLSHGVFLQRLAADAAAGKDSKGRPTVVFGGGVGASFGAKRQFAGILEAEPLSMDGRIALSILASPSTANLANEAPWGVEITGDAKLVDIPIANASLTFDPSGRVTLKGRQELSAFGFGVSAEITDAFFDPLKLDLGIRARGTATFPGLGQSDAEVAASRTGIAVCGRVLGSSRIGFGKRFTVPPQPFEMFAGGCDVGPFAATASAAAAVDGPHTVQVERGRRLLVLAARGTVAAPKVTVRAPGGASEIVTPGGPEGIRTPRTLLVQAPELRTTFVLVRDPAPGAWTVSGDGIAGVRVAAERPPVKVRASVRKGRLRWQLRPLPGQRVTFVERGPHTTRTIVTTARARGSARYRPAATRDRKRTIVAEVVQDGLPRATPTVARVKVEPARLSPIRGLKVKRGRATWKAQRAAASYAVALRFANGRTVTRSVRVPRVALGRRLPVTVTVVAVGADGRAGTSTAVRVRKR
jgi:hypothetical protein